MAVFSSDVLAVTREKIVPKAYDTISKGSPFLLKTLRNAKDWKSGYDYENIFQYRQATNGGNVGLTDKLNTNRENVLVKGKFDPKMASFPVVVGTVEEVLNMGDERVLPLVETTFDSQAKALMQTMATNLYNGTDAGNDMASIDMAADDGTNYGTYASLSRTTYASLKGYYLASAGALTLNKMATAYDAVEIGVDSPTDIFTTKTLWSAYEALLSPTVRAGYQTSGFPTMDQYGNVGKAPGMGGQQGFSALWFRGTPVMKDEQCPSGRMYFVNSNYFGFKGVDLSPAEGFETLNFKNSNDGTPAGVPGRVMATRGFNFRVFQMPVDQFAKVGHLAYVGNFTSENPRLQGQMRGLSA